MDTKRNKRRLDWVLIAIITVTVLVVVAVLAYAVMQKSDSSNEEQQVATKPTQTIMESRALIYAESKKGKEIVQNDDPEEGISTTCTENSTDVYYRPLDGSEAVKAVSLDDFQDAIDMDSYGNTVVFATNHTCASTGGPSLWASRDSGRTYKKILTFDDKTGEISSLKLSPSGESVAVGYTPEWGKAATIQVVDIGAGTAGAIYTSKSVKTEFSVKAYNSDKQIVYFTEVCSGCSNVDPLDLMKFTVGGSSSIVLPKADVSSYDITVNHDISRVVRAEYSFSSGSQLSQFVVNEYKLGTDKPVSFAAYTGTISAGITRAGYAVDGSVYYNAGQQIMTITSDGQTAELASVPDKIAQIYAVGKSHVIYRTGDVESGKVVDYNVKSKQAATLYEYGSISQGLPLGVSYSL